MPDLSAGGVLEGAAGFPLSATGVRLSRTGGSSNQDVLPPPTRRASGSERGMELYAIDGNPVPDGAVVGTVVTPRRRAAALRALADDRQRRSRGTVCLLQGRGEAIEKYFETVGDLRRRGFAVAIFDWRGQGGSDRRLRNPLKAHVDSFAEYDRDLEAFMPAGDAARLSAAALSRSPIRWAR